MSQSIRGEKTKGRGFGKAVVARNYRDMYKASALSLRERVAESLVTAGYRTSRRTTLTRASRTLSRRERVPVPSYTSSLQIRILLDSVTPFMTALSIVADGYGVTFTFT